MSSFVKLKTTTQIISFLMLSAMLFIAARYAVLRSVVKVQKKEFRNTVLMEHRNETKKIIVKTEDIYQDINGIEWKENNKEVVINGKYHEVISVEKKGGNFIVNIIEDRKENELFKNYFDKLDAKGQLANCITLVMAMNFIITEPLELKKQIAIKLENSIKLIFENGVKIYSRIERPPIV